MSALVTTLHLCGDVVKERAEAPGDLDGCVVLAARCHRGRRRRYRQRRRLCLRV
jgi:hypothetical protein